MARETALMEMLSDGDDLQEDAGAPGKAKRRSRARTAPKFDVRAYLFGMCGVDLTRINGIDAAYQPIFARRLLPPPVRSP